MKVNKFIIKRAFDFILSLVSLVLLSPLFLTLAIIIKLTTKGPIFFKQRRIGKNNIEFNIYKFRTMKVDTPNVATHLLKNSEQCITPIGKILRKTSMDELPQLLNILKGEMSLVGPRPALFNQYDLIKIRTENEIHKLLPGLTGWAQVNGRDEITIEAKVKLDIEYETKQSILFDVKVIFLTVLKVIKRENVKEG